MQSREITALLVIAAHRIRVQLAHTPVQKHKRHPVGSHVLDIMALPKTREIKDPVDGQGNRRVDQLFSEGILQLHAQNHQGVATGAEFPIHAVDEIAVVLVAQVIDNDGDHTAAAGAQGRGHGVWNISHAVCRFPDERTCGSRETAVVSKST